MWERVARLSGYKVKYEQSNLVLSNPGLRADLFLSQLRILTDLRTVVTCGKKLCVKAATSPGTAAEAGTAYKNDKWKHLVEAQGDIFLALVHEEGGRISEPALALLDRFARHCSTSISEQNAFKTYALQRLHTVGQVGVARLCRAVQPIPVGPTQISVQSHVRRLSAPTRTPAGSSLTNQITQLAIRPTWHSTALTRVSRRTTPINQTTTSPLTSPASPILRAQVLHAIPATNATALAPVPAFLAPFRDIFAA